MNLLVIGFPEPDLRALGQLLQQAGHRVLSAPGREGARAFAQALVPDAVVVPEGPRGVEVAAWLEPSDGGPPPRVVAVPVGPVALARVEGRAPETAAILEGPPADAAPPGPPTPAPPAPPGPPTEPVEVSAPPAGPTATSPRVARWAEPTPSLEGVGAELHPELTAKLSQVRFADYFALLEVEPDASTWVIREGHDRLARRFSARGWPHRLSPAELEALDEVGRGLADAFLVLGDDELRARYQRSLAAAAQGAAPTAPAPRSTLPVR